MHQCIFGIFAIKFGLVHNLLNKLIDKINKICGIFTIILRAGIEHKEYTPCSTHRASSIGIFTISSAELYSLGLKIDLQVCMLRRFCLWRMNLHWKLWMHKWSLFSNTKIFKTSFVCRSTTTLTQCILWCSWRNVYLLQPRKLSFCTSSFSIKLGFKWFNEREYVTMVHKIFLLRNYISFFSSIFLSTKFMHFYIVLSCIPSKVVLKTAPE